MPHQPDGSQIQPVLEVNLEAFEHLFSDIFYVGKPAPTSHIAVFKAALDLHYVFFDQRQLVPVFFPKMLFANLRSLFLQVFGFLIPYR